MGQSLMKTQTFQFLLNYDHLDWSNGVPTTNLMVDIHREYLVWTEFALIGNIGGMMGMTIGFSFMSYIGFALDIIPRLWRQMLAKSG